MTDKKQINHYASLLSQGRMSRREFMGRSVALGATLTAASTLAGKALQAAEPKSGGTLRMAIGGGATSDTFDPATYYESYMQTVGYGMRNCLAEMNNDDELVPELAESWEASADAVTWTIKLRKGVEFHNGKTFDADDAIASLQYQIGPDSKSPAKAILKSIQEMKKEDAHTVKITLSEGNIGFPALLTDYHAPMMPVVNGELEIMSGVGTGAYKIENFEAGQRAMLVKNPNYWKEGKGHFDECIVLSVIDVPARTNALVTGEVDAADRMDLKTLHLLKRNKNIKIEEPSGSQYFAYVAMVDREPFSNPDVRLALKYAINREELLRKLLYGHGYIGNDNPIGRTYKYHAELEQRPYDLDKAKFHMKKAGMDEINVQLYAADAAFAGAIDGAVLYSESAKGSGINIEAVRTPNDGYWTNINRVKPWTATYWNPRVTEDMMFSTAFSDDAPWNETNWDNKRFNELLRAARVEFDEDKRANMYREMQQLCTDDCGAIIPLFANYVFAMDEKVQHGRLAASWDLDGTKCLERWWFA